MYAKTEKLTDTLSVFTTNEWKFDNSNTRKLWTLLSQEDRKTFHFNFEGIDWRLYIRLIVYGVRKHILHEDLNNITKALSKHRKYVGVFSF
jgi:alcohol-forming fatty acyl-CoA reductase